MKNQEDLLWKFDWDTLVVLDACRYDYFNDLYLDHVTKKGVLSKVRSPASQTYPWLHHMFPDKYECHVYSAHPGINSKGVARAGTWKADEHFKTIDDLWDWGWDNELSTVHPTIVVEKVMDDINNYELRDKNIIWFMQPHFPYIGKFKIEAEWVNDKRMLKHAWTRIIEGEYPVSAVREAYRDNLTLVLDSLDSLLPNIGGRTVVTGDHGELLGEYTNLNRKQRFGHWPGMDLPELREVPWLELKL